MVYQDDKAEVKKRAIPITAPGADTSLLRQV